MLWELRRTGPSHDSVFLAGCFCTLSLTVVRLSNADKDNSLTFPCFLARGLKAVGFSFFILFFLFLSNSVIDTILAS